MGETEIRAENFHIVLVEPEESLNIGSVARAMMNLGFSSIHLVKPGEYSFEKASITACWAKELLAGVKIHSTFEDALNDFEDVIGFSGRLGKNRTGAADLFSWAETLRVEAPKRTALVFGPESTGLREEHVEKCRALVSIPATAENPSYNLAQAVLLVLFELRRGTWPDISGPELPQWGDFEQLDKLTESVLSLSGFYREGTPEPVPGVVKQLFRRTKPNKREMGILLGLFGRIERHFAYLEGK